MKKTLQDHPATLVSTLFLISIGGRANGCKNGAREIWSFEIRVFALGFGDAAMSKTQAR
jgi:hypothetical protein